MEKKIVNQNGKVNIILVLTIIVIILSVVLMIKIITPTKTNKYTNIDVYTWLDNIEKIDNISYEYFHYTGKNKGSHLKEFIYNGNIKKMIYMDDMGNSELDLNITVENNEAKTMIHYNENTKKGRRYKISASKDSKYVYVSFTDSFSNLKKDKYEITETLLNGKECVKAKGTENTIYFDSNTKLIIRIEDTKEPDVCMIFDNLSVNTVTEEDVSVPNDIVFTN